MRERYDVAIVGAGLVGLATAYQLLRSTPGLGVAILDKEPDVATHQSGHNSGVLHAGLYYRPGSLRAQLCVRGKEEIEAFAADHGIPFIRRGKVVVALDDTELSRLEELERRGRANGIPGLEMIGPEELRAIEPHIVGIRALRVPGTGVIDFRRVAAALSEEIRAAGAEVHLGREVVGIARRGEDAVLRTPQGELAARHVVTCAGLHSDRMVRLAGAEPQARIVPFRGDYFSFRPEAAHLVRGLVYPVPDPAFPFLGVHFTRGVDEHVHAGPNAVLALAREGYRRRDFDLRDLADTLGNRGFRRLARRHWRAGAKEVWRDAVKRAFVRDCRRYLPELRSEDLVFGPSGVRAQALDQDGALVDDFVIQRTDGATHVQNAPSPAATASLAIGRVIAGRVADELGTRRVS